jgi:hypothetical protein
MGVLRVSDATEKFLYENSRMGDTFDTVMRRLHPEIEAFDKPTGPASSAGEPATANPQGTTKKRAKRGTVAPAGMFKPYILRVLLGAAGHRMRMPDLMPEIEKLVKPKLTALDYEKLTSGDVVRWQNRAQWDRAEMVQQGLLEPPAVSGRGMWMLSAKGVAEARKLK